MAEAKNREEVIAEEETRDESAARRMPLGFGHGEFTGGSLAPAISLRRE